MGRVQRPSVTFPKRTIYKNKQTILFDIDFTIKLQGKTENRAGSKFCNLKNLRLQEIDNLARQQPTSSGLLALLLQHVGVISIMRPISLLKFN